MEQVCVGLDLHNNIDRYSPALLLFWSVVKKLKSVQISRNTKFLNYFFFAGSNHGVLRPVYILQPEMAPLTNGKHGRQYRRYDRGRSFSPPKYFRGQYPPQGYVEAIPLHPEYNTCSGNNGSEFNGRDNHSGTENHFGLKIVCNKCEFVDIDNSDAGGRLQHPELEGDRPKTGRPHGFRKSFSSDQLYFNDRLPAKQEPYSFSLSSRSSSTSTGK